MNKTLEGMETERKRVVVDSQGFCDDTAPMRAALLWLADNFTLNAQTSTLVELPTKQPGSQLVHSGLLVAAALRQIARGGRGISDLVEQVAPATDICEWEKLRNSSGFKVSCSTKWLMNENYGGVMCPLCDKRIEYKFEPATTATDPAPVVFFIPRHSGRTQAEGCAGGQGMNDIIKVLRDLCDNNYNDNFEKVLNDLLDYYDHDNIGVVKALDSINESISLEGLDAMEAAIEEIKKLRAENERLRNEKVAMQDTANLPEATERSTPATDPTHRPGCPASVVYECTCDFHTDPAPVCEWANGSRRGGGRTTSTCMPDGLTAWVWNGRNQGKCPNCWNEIKFTEAKE